MPQLFRTLLAFSILSLPAVAQSTWYVDGSGTPPGSGTQADPFVSIQQAIDAPATHDGHTILVAPGTYLEALDFVKAVTVRSTAGPLATVLRPPSAGATLVTMGYFNWPIPVPTLEGFHVERGGSTPEGVGVLILKGGQGRLNYCIVSGHTHGVDNEYDAFLYGCTVTRNTRGMVDGSGQAIHYLRNSIVHQNLVRDFQLSGFNATVQARYSALGNLAELLCSPCSGSFDADPRFWDAAGGDFRLRPDSPCVDAGDPADPLDPDGSRRDIGALPFDAAYAPGTATSCFGDALLCPCGNGGSGEGGCDLAQGTGGVELAIASFTPNGAGGGTAQLVGTGYPPAGQPGVTVIRSPALEPAPVVFGDGLRCIAASGLVRVSTTLAEGGASLNALTHGAGAGTFHYQLWVRNNPASYCDPLAAFNLSNVLSVTWP